MILTSCMLVVKKNTYLRSSELRRRLNISKFPTDGGGVPAVRVAAQATSSRQAVSGRHGAHGGGCPPVCLLATGQYNAVLLLKRKQPAMISLNKDLKKQPNFTVNPISIGTIFLIKKQLESELYLL